MKDFIINNWQWIACLVVGTIELFFVIFKKSQKVDTLKEKILSLLPVLISMAEELLGPGVGSEKKRFVSDLLHRLLRIDSSYDQFVSSAIESILSTPTKKAERKNDEK